MDMLYEGATGGIRLVGSLPGRFFCPPFFAKRLEFMFSIDLSDTEKMCLFNALCALAKAMENEGIIEERRFANIFFISGESLTLTQTDFRVLGTCSPIIIYYVSQWHKVPGLTELGIIAIILEELCHTIFMIEDEYEVKHKVTEVYRLIHPETTMYDLFHSVLRPQDLAILLQSENQ